MYPRQSYYRPSDVVEHAINELSLLFTSVFCSLLGAHGSFPANVHNSATHKKNPESWPSVTIKQYNEMLVLVLLLLLLPNVCRRMPYSSTLQSSVLRTVPLHVSKGKWHNTVLGSKNNGQSGGGEGSENFVAMHTRCTHCGNCCRCNLF